MASRTYTGWKAGLLVVFAVVVLMTVLNVAGRALRDDDTPRHPPKVVTSVTP